MAWFGAAIAQTMPPSGMPETEAAEVQAQAAHTNPRMRFRLLNSRFNPRLQLWRELNAELDQFGVLQYEALKPLVLEQDIPTLQRSISDGRLSYAQLTTFYLYRIRQFESDNSRYLNALISIDPDALRQARLRDQLRSSGAVEPREDSIFGMPILLKDNIGFASLPTTAGALVLQDNQTDDAFITQRLKANGAVILGKANLSEWAYYFCDGCPLGYSAMGGQTLNPYGRKIIESGGSSSGSAVAVAANYAVAAVGTETSGSILSPASMNSTVGLKPTTGLLSRSGIVPISGTLDTPGPIARSVTDAVILLNAMAGYDQQDTAMPLLSAEVVLQSGNGSLTGRRLGYFANLLDRPLYQAALDGMRNAGAMLVEIPPTTPVLNNFSEFLGAEMKRDLPIYLAQSANASVFTLSVEDVQQFNLANLESRAPYGQGRFDAMQRLSMTVEELANLHGQLRSSALQLLEVPVVSLQLDAVVSLNNVHAAFAALANYPALTVPAGFTDDGTPVGLTFIAPAFSEQMLVDIARGFEALARQRKIPTDYQ
ncbi:MAG: amidase family protein [Pseudohongiellaceae bacterium]